MPIASQCNVRIAAALLSGAAAALAGAADDLRAAQAAVRAEEARRVEVFAQAARATVCIFDEPSAAGGGSGVVISEEGYGLTNVHVVMSFLESRRGYGGLSDGNLYPLTVLGIDPGGDIALFQLAGKPQFDFAPLGDSAALRVGEWVAAMGNPFNVAEDYTPTITLGIISGLNRYQEGQGNTLEYADCIQVSTSINPGNSGGPLFDLQGRVVGINGRASFEERGRVNVGLGYAVSINQIKRFLPGLYAGRMCEHGALGATVSVAGEDLIINALQEVSPAEKAGLKLGDVLLSVGGRPLRTPNDFNNALAILPAGWPVELEARRDQQRLRATARLERLPVRLSKPYLVDLQRNHAELRRLWGRYERLDRKAAGQAVARLEFHGTLTWPGGNQPQRAELSAVFAAPAALRVESGGETFAIEGATLEDLSERWGAPGEDWRAAAVWCEWVLLMQPLLRAPAPGAGWEVLAGDEVDGRLAGVVERRGGGVRLRWKFDFESGQLLAATAGTDEQPERIAWRPSARREVRGLIVPTAWVRRDERGVEWQLQIERFEPAFEAPPPRGAGE